MFLSIMLRLHCMRIVFCIMRFPVWYMSFETMNVNGSIYVPVSSADDYSSMNITGVDVGIGDPLILTCEDFYYEYDDAVDQGFYLSHDFIITRDIPPYPSEPFSTSSETTDVDVKSATPGFELLFLIAALICFIQANKKK